MAFLQFTARLFSLPDSSKWRSQYVEQCEIKWPRSQFHIFGHFLCSSTATFTSSRRNYVHLSFLFDIWYPDRSRYFTFRTSPLSPIHFRFHKDYWSWSRNGSSSDLGIYGLEDDHFQSRYLQTNSSNLRVWRPIDQSFPDLTWNTIGTLKARRTWLAFLADE